MAFKMKGPGLPGWKKQNSSGFYKSTSKLDANKRSPILQAKDATEATDDIVNITKEAEAKAMSEWNQMSPEEREAAGPWTKYSNNKVKEVRDNSTALTTIERQFAIVKGDEVEDIVKPGDPGYDEWLEAVTKDPSIEDRYKDKLVIRENKEVQIFEPKKDIEYTNFRLSYGHANHKGTTKIDKNDYTARFNLAGMDGVNMTGQLSKNDIEKLVEEGKLKYEEGSTGSSGQLFMSKDFYDNYYMPQQEMYLAGQRRKEMFHADAKAYRQGMNRHVNEKLAEEFPGGDTVWNKKHEQRKRELELEYRKAGAEKNYYANERGTGRPSDIPGWMYNDPNYGQVAPGIYNEDETTFNWHGKNTHSYGQLQQIDGHGNSRKGGRWDHNLQGDRGLDWIKTDKTDEYGLPVYELKDGAKTLPPEEYAKLTQEERKELIMSTAINGGGVNLHPGPGRRDEDGKWVPGGYEDRPTRYDHLLSGNEEITSMKETAHNRHNLEATEDQVSKGGAESEKDNLKVETEETNLGYTREDKEIIDNY